jgi:hypothetical protein
MADASQGYTGKAPRTGWVGWIYFAGIMMLMLGSFHAIQGLVAIFNSAYYVVVSNGLLIHVSYTAWGWLFLIVGVVVAAAGLGVMFGQTWARVVGVIAALVSALVNLAFISAYPLWSVLVIALDVVVIYALTVHGGQARADW